MTEHDAERLLPAEAHAAAPLEVHVYDTLLEVAGTIANAQSWRAIFPDYQKTLSPNTQRRQLDDLETFSRYLQCAGIVRSAQDLYSDPYAWAGMSYGLLKGYLAWSLQQGYAIGTINVRLATIRQYCTLAGPPPEGAGVLSEQDVRMILTVRGLSGKRARNADRERREGGTPTRIGAKKAQATPLHTGQALRLKKVTTTARRVNARDRLLPLRDALMMGLFLEHALRCGELAALTIEQIDLYAGTLSFYREKTDMHTKHRLERHTLLAAVAYLDALKAQGITSGPLFLGYGGRPLSMRAINKRVNALGRLVGVDTLSPHDLRHRWTQDALEQGTPIDRVQSGGGWRSPTMVLRYAAREGIANDGVKITEEQPEIEQQNAHNTDRAERA